MADLQGRWLLTTADQNWDTPAWLRRREGREGEALHTRVVSGSSEVGATRHKWAPTFSHESLSDVGHPCVHFNPYSSQPDKVGKKHNQSVVHTAPPPPGWHSAERAPHTALHYTGGNQPLHTSTHTHTHTHTRAQGSKGSSASPSQEWLWPWSRHLPRR